MQILGLVKFEDVLILAVILFASILQGFSGFGYGLVLMTVLPFFLPVKSATVITSVSVIFICLYMVWQNRNHLNPRLIIFPMIGSFLFIPFGVFLLNFLNEEILKIVLGVLLILVSLFYLVRENRDLKIRVTKRNGALSGMVSGTLGGMLGIGGPPLVIYFIQAAGDKYEYKASLDSIFLLASIYRSFWLLFFGNITKSMIPLLSGAIVAGLIGTMIGFTLMMKTEKASITRAVYIIMIIAGLSLIFL